MTIHAEISLKDLPEWPAALSYEESLLYSRLSESEIRRQTQSGALVFKPIGANGRMVCLRSQLDEVMKRIFSGETAPISGPLEYPDFGNG